MSDKMMMRLGKKPMPKEKMPEMEDTMMYQSGIRPSPEMVRAAKDMAAKEKSKK